MSDKSDTNDEEQAEDYCNLDETEHYAFELGVKEIIREAVDDTPEFGKGESRMIEDIDKGNTHSIYAKGVYRITISYGTRDRNDLLGAVADNPLIEIAELDDDAAILVHADYLNEYYRMMELMREEDEE
jgi:hypothetical protein